MNDASDAAPAFDTAPIGRLNVPKAGDVLADQLRKRIRSGELREGQALPAERELVQQTGLSRMSVREALRLLEAEGLIETRPGRNGGSHVRRPAGDVLARHLELFIWGRNAGIEDLHDVREALEALAAEGAARRRTDADIRELTARTAALELAVRDVDAYLAANVEWHMAIVTASHNPLLIGLMNVLENVIHDATARAAFESPDVRASTVKIHRRILAAVVAGDTEAARCAMTRDVAAARRLATSPDRADNDGAPLSASGQKPSRTGATSMNLQGSTGRRVTRKRRARL